MFNYGPTDNCSREGFPNRLDDGFAEPVVEVRLGESRAGAGHERALLQFCAEIARVRIGDHFTRIVAGAEASPDEIIQTELLGPRHFNDPVHWRSFGNPANGTRDILGRHGLDQYGCESHSVALGRGSS